MGVVAFLVGKRSLRGRNNFNQKTFMNTVNPKITACVSFLVKDNKVLLGIATAGPCKAKRNGPGGKYEKAKHFMVEMSVR